MADPSMIKRSNRTCWKVLTVLRLTVHKPDRVMALTTKNSASMNLTLLAGVLAPQKTTAAIRHVTMKYA